MVTTDDVMAEVNELRDAINTASITLAELPAAIENREQARITTGIATSDEDGQAISKWFSHFRDGDEIQSSVDAHPVENTDGKVEYIIVESEMHSDRKQQHGDGDGIYHARWVVGEDNDTDEYFVHRCDWEHSFENGLDAIEDPMETVHDWLGFETELPEDLEDADTGTWYRAQGDLAIKFRGVSNHINRRAKKRTKSILNKLREENLEEWQSQDGVIQTHDDIRLWDGTVKIDVERTDELKDLQADLGISEETLRRKMRDDWQQLTAKRRKKLIKKHVRSKIRKVKNADLPDKEPIRERCEKEVEKELREETGQENHVIGNHLLICDNVTDRRTRISGGDLDITIPDTSTLNIIHDEHTNKTLQITESIVAVKLLDRHENA